MTDEELEFDESWYLEQHRDVAKAVAVGKFQSAEAHYREFGEQEKRMARWRDAGRIFAFGAYGTNNVGDEAIFEGIKRVHPRCRQIFVNKPRYDDAVWVVNAMEEKDFFRTGDYLIIGGGGLLYHPEPINQMIELAEKVKLAGGRVDILGLGAEAALPEFGELIRKLFSLADQIALRSSTSQEIVAEICGTTYPTQEDFALNLADEAGGAAPVSCGEDLRIGVVTGGDYLVDYSELSRLIQLNTMGKDGPKITFQHIPHSRAYVSSRNNDVVVGHALWSSINIYHKTREDLFELTPFEPDPLKVLQTYGTLDAVITERFHGMIFAHMHQLPTLAMSGGTLKNQSFIRDHASDSLFVSKDPADLVVTFGKFLKFIQENRKQAAASGPAEAPPVKAKQNTDRSN